MSIRVVFVIFMVIALTAVMPAFGCLDTTTSLVINEIMVSNNEWLQDPQGGYDDWIEIYNAGDAVIDIAGMYLTDRPLNRGRRWQIPQGSRETIIPIGGYLLIWADADAGDRPGLHTNFKLSADGEEIALLDTGGNPIDSITFDAQLPDKSYGRYPDASNEWRVFESPTPGEANSGLMYRGIVAEPEFSQERGFYETSLDVAVTSETEGATIYYTLDGSEPKETDRQYTNPIPISSTTALRARAFKMGWLPSPVANHPADVLFNASSIPVFELELPEDEWAELQKNAALKEYTEAVLTYEGENMGPVGLRFKGGVPRPAEYDEEGNLLYPKVPIKIKFDKYNEDKRFFGMKRLNFNSMQWDDTKMTEKISYGLFRDMGIPAPRTGWAVLKVNGTLYGLFILVEQVDGRFTDDRWPDGGDGNLYKGVWPQSPLEESYSRGIKTNEETATHERMVAFHEAMDAAAPADRLAVLEEWTDVDQLYNYMAVHDAIMYWDGVTSWYCGNGDCGPHNYYWYQHETDNEFTLIPWDLDNTLRPRSPHVMMNYVPHWTVSPNDCNRRYPAFFGLEVAAPGCFPIFQALASDHDRYAEAVQNLVDGPFNIATLKDQIDQYADLIREAVVEDPTMSVEPWEGAVERLKNDLDLLTLKLKSHRDGVPVNPVALLTSGVNDFEDLNNISYLLGVTPGSNAMTTVSLVLNDQTPINGAQDCRMEFAYRDQGTDAWAQWSHIWIPTVGGGQDLSAFTGVKLRLQTEEPRTVRICLDSNPFGMFGIGPNFGWEVKASNTPTLVTLLFGDAEIPSWASTTDDLEDVLTSIWGLSFSPGVNGRGSKGLLGEGVVDSGFLQIDDIEFLH